MKFKVIRNNLGLIILGAGLIYANWTYVMPILNFVGGLVDGIVYSQKHKGASDAVGAAAINATTFVTDKGTYVLNEDFKNFTTVLALVKETATEAVSDTLDNVYNMFAFITGQPLEGAVVAKASDHAAKLIEAGVDLRALVNQPIETSMANLTQISSLDHVTKVQTMRTLVELDQMRQFRESPSWWVGRSIMSAAAQPLYDAVGVWNFFRTVGTQRT